MADEHPADPSTLVLTIDTEQVTLSRAGAVSDLAATSRTLERGGLHGADPPHPADLTNALGEVTDALDDVWRDQPALRPTTVIALSGPEAHHLARVERGASELAWPIELTRADIEDLFRTLVNERRLDRVDNPALDPRRVDSIVATCCIVLALLRSTDTDTVTVIAPADRDPDQKQDRAT